MEKIPTLFERDETVKGHPVKNSPKPELMWVLQGEGIATRKLDGTNVKVQDGKLFKRQKPKDRDYDNAAYIPADPDSPADKYLFEAFNSHHGLPDGIYEAVGPKIQGNPEGFVRHKLVSVVPVDPDLILEDVPRTFDGLKAYLSPGHIEGIVFHHPDGRLAKIKGRDFGFPRNKAQ